MAKHRTLIVVDTVGWAIDRLMQPLRAAADLCYHYTDTVKQTGIGVNNPVHFTVDLLKDYDQIHFTTIRAVDCILKNQEIVKLLEGKRLIMTIHTERERDLELIKGDHWQRIDTFVSPTRYQQGKVKEYTGKDAIYIPHAIDEKKYKFIKEPKGTAIGYIGRVTQHKRLKEIVEASRSYKVVGIGYVDDGRSGYWQSIPKGNLTMYQHLTEEQKIDVMSKFKVLVSISEPHIETGPLGVLECAAMGIPIITTDVGWARNNLTKHRTIMLVPEDQMDQLPMYIESLINGDKHREELRQNARKVIDNWTLSDYINAYKGVYEKV